MPRQTAQQQLLDLRLHSVLVELKLPLFLATGGLNTQFTALNCPELWAATALVLLLAVAGKFAGTWATVQLSDVHARQA